MRRGETFVIGPAQNNGDNVVLQGLAQLLGEVIVADLVLRAQVEVVVRKMFEKTKLLSSFVAFQISTTSENVDLNIFFSSKFGHEIFPSACGMAVTDEPNDFDDLTALEGSVVCHQR